MLVHYPLSASDKGYLKIFHSILDYKSLSRVPTFFSYLIGRNRSRAVSGRHVSRRRGLALEFPWNLKQASPSRLAQANACFSLGEHFAPLRDVPFSCRHEYGSRDWPMPIRPWKSPLSSNLTIIVSRGNRAQNFWAWQT